MCSLFIADTAADIAVARISGKAVGGVDTGDALKFDLRFTRELAGLTVDRYYERNSSAVRKFSPLADDVIFDSPRTIPRR
jgi:hypothetical protein